MGRLALTWAFLALAACDGTAWNTTVAGNMALRAQMAASVQPGRTTETGFITRWGRPVQKVRDGGQVEYIYRDMRGPDGLQDGRGDSANYVIVTFQYGIATAVRTSETEVCRATFAPRPPGHGFSNPTTVRPVATCPGLYRPPVGAPVLPTGTGVAGAGVADSGAAGGAMASGSAAGGTAAGGTAAGGTAAAGGASESAQAGGGAATGDPAWPRAEPIYEDTYVGDPAKGK